MHRFILHNDSIRDASEPCLTPGQVGLLAGWGVFSTIRVSRGVLFAFERHWARMKRDAINLRVPFPDRPEWMEERLLRLVRANDADDATLRVVVVRNKGGIWQGPADRDYDLIALTTGLTDWGVGVRLGVVRNARFGRSRFAGTKVTAWGFNLTWYEEAHEEDQDEVVLLDEEGNVSECTSANLFAVFGNQVLTPPLSSGCLPGITRELLLSEVTAAPWTVSERTLTPADLEAAGEVFITSTTRDVLPVESIAGLQIRRDRTASAALCAALRRYIDAYVEARLSAPVPGNS
jgi:branched-chain amino acid aminotransferase